MIQITNQNRLIHFGRLNVTLVSSVLRFLSTYKTLNNSNIVEPVKLAYASYESMKENSNVTIHPIVIMHGLFGSKNNWNSLSKAIHQKSQRKVIAVDARNHGDSPHSSEMSYKHMAKDIVQLLNDLELEKAILIGHSMGGSTMMYLALHYPELVEKLVVVDMSPARPSPSLTEMVKIFKVMRSITLDGSPSLSKARKMAEEQLAKVVKPLALRQFLTMNLVEAEPGKYKWRVNLPVLEQNFSTEIAIFPNVAEKVYMGPTLFIGGSNSDYIKIEDHPAIKKLFTRAEFLYVAGADHWVHADKPAEFIKIVTNFINQTHS
ncbi:protein ABHD11 isoform X1 [Vespa velutina]|uniref:protein ABHD11 isoform X1 n=1 Tax=Vespa velutina TaxID=202808 RepID=UPI001FB1F1FE|nr:protein ABHD11 isoform X1 [Vespa velutina]XP_047349084.1 protein ABHD11 isoform X1 [Vespa velutina]XP_047349085.1 protein ABHD11 isoform X1 [Vespa velutina]